MQVIFKLSAILDGEPTAIAVPKAAEAIKNLCSNNPENKVACRYAGAIPLLVRIFRPRLLQESSV